MALFFDINLKDVFTNWITAAIILILGLIVGKMLGKISKKILHKFKLNKIIYTSTGIRSSLEEFIALFIEIFIYFIAITMALEQLNVANTVLNIVSGAIILFIFISMLLALKDILPNIFAGIYVLNKLQLKPGMLLGLDGIKGKVKEVTILETKLETKSKEMVYIPNSNFMKQKARILKSL